MSYGYRCLENCEDKLYILLFVFNFEIFVNFYCNDYLNKMLIDLFGIFFFVDESILYIILRLIIMIK